MCVLYGLKFGLIFIEGVSLFIFIFIFIEGVLLTRERAVKYNEIHIPGAAPNLTWKKK